MRIACFDIGRINFAFYVEDTNPNGYSDLKKKYHSLPKKLQRKYKGPMNDECKQILKDIFKRGTRVAMRVVDLTLNEVDNSYNNDVRLNLYIYLKKYEDLWNTCDLFLIEEQYYNPRSNVKAKKGVNKDAILMGESCYSYFIQNHYPFRNVSYFKAALKTQTLGCDDYIYKIDRKTKLRTLKKVQKYDRKKWSIEKTKEIFTLRNDLEGLDLIKDGKKIYKQKQDDVSDCVIMCQAYIFKHFILNS